MGVLLEHPAMGLDASVVYKRGLDPTLTTR